MKTPGHAMTAQAGAEECDECGMMCSPNEYHPYAACLMFKGCQRGDIVRANLPTPPAAVPVEALEGLVKEWREDADDMHASAMRAQKRGDMEAMYCNLDAAKDARGYADELTQLIKERSNG